MNKFDSSASGKPKLRVMEDLFPELCCFVSLSSIRMLYLNFFFEANIDNWKVIYISEGV
jgi:hypothetical protein